MAQGARNPTAGFVGRWRSIAGPQSTRMSCGTTGDRRWALLRLIRSSMPPRTAREGWCALRCVLFPAPCFSGPAGPGRRTGPGRERPITIMNTHESVAFTWLDNSHDGRMVTDPGGTLSRKQPFSEIGELNVWAQACARASGEAAPLPAMGQVVRGARRATGVGRLFICEGSGRTLCSRPLGTRTKGVYLAPLFPLQALFPTARWVVNTNNPRKV